MAWASAGGGWPSLPSLLVLALCLTLPGTLYAASEKAAGETKQEAASGENAPQGRTSSARPRKPAKTFKPSERIRADSAVSFPVDI